MADNKIITLTKHLFHALERRCGSLLDLRKQTFLIFVGKRRYRAAVQRKINNSAAL